MNQPSPQPQPEPGSQPPPLPPGKSGPKLFWIVLIVFCFICLCGGGSLSLLAAIFVPSFRTGFNRGRARSVRSDLQTVAIAIEAYNIDHNAYPAYTTNLDESIDEWSFRFDSEIPYNGEPTFVAYELGRPMSLTTPVAYLTENITDKFAFPEGRTFCYYSDGEGWIIWSPGPDRHYDLDWTLYDGAADDNMERLVSYAYDPTNGVFSYGDMIQMKE